MQEEDRSTAIQLSSEQQSQLVSSYGHSCCGAALGIDDGAALDVGLVLGWVDEVGEIEGLALGIDDGATLDVGLVLVLGLVDGAAEIEG